MLLTRRAFCVGGAALGLASATSGPAFSTLRPAAGDVAFDVFRNGSEIGYHNITVSTMGTRTVANIEILLEVGLGPIVLYRYRHKNEEIWDGDQFVSFESETDNDGEPFKIRAERREDGIFVYREHDEDFLVPGFDALPTTYWNPKTVTRSQMIDTQKGRLMDVAVQEGDWQMVDTKNGTVEAQQFDIAGDLNLSIWYDREGAWSKLSFPFKGATFDYLKTV